MNSRTGFFRILARARYEFRTRLSVHPSLYFPVMNMVKSPSGDNVMAVSDRTDIVIEAFPRSGNTFAVIAFRLAQPAKIEIAHHLHAPAQIMAAVKKNIPSLVIIRKPEDAVVSLLLRCPEISPLQGFRAWMTFYDSLLPYRSGFVTATFDDVTRNFGRVIEHVNERFNTNFSLFDHTPELEKKCFESIEEGNKRKFGNGSVIETWVARPSDVRKAMKASVLKQIHSMNIDKTVEKANKLYNKFSQADGEGPASGDKTREFRG